MHRDRLQRHIDSAHLLRRLAIKTMKAPEGHPRQPWSSIPPDLKCLGCPELPPFKAELAFRGHMWAKHQQLYTLRDLAPKAMAHLGPAPEDRTTLEPWHAVAIAQHALFGKSWAQIAEEMRGGKGEATMKAVASSPAGEALRQKISEIVGDPMALVQLLMKEHMLQAFADHLVAREWARDAKDYKALHAMTKDIDLLPVLEGMKKPQTQTATVLTVHLNGGKLDTAEVSTDYVVVESDVAEE